MPDKTESAPQPRSVALRQIEDALADAGLKLGNIKSFGFTRCGDQQGYLVKAHVFVPFPETESESSRSNRQLITETIQDDLNHQGPIQQTLLRALRSAQANKEL
jgi:hypothetical protein